jgi:uncharacterized protein YndB with AHSA1/START domain
MTPPASANDAIVQEITINAPAARIFDALTDPDQLLLWWRMEDQFKLVRALCDVRSGGKWTMRVMGQGPGEEQRESIVHGVYRTVVPPHLLEYTWIREEEQDHPETIVRWELQQYGKETLVRVTHSGLTTPRLRERNSGWIFIVQLLKEYIEE